MTLSERDVEFLRATQSLLMPDVCTIEELTTLPDGYGGRTEAWLPRPGTVPCRIGAPTATEARIIQERASEGEAWVVSLPYGTEIRVGDRLRIGLEVFVATMIHPAGTWQSAQRVTVGRAGG